VVVGSVAGWLWCGVSSVTTAVAMSNYVNKYLRLKFQSTFMDYAFDKLITAADDDRQQQPYIDLANRLFDSFESLQQAVTAKDDPNITQRYADTKIILQELMTKDGLTTILMPSLSSSIFVTQ
jgi:hypothetical protein